MLVAQRKSDQFVRNQLVKKKYLKESLTDACIPRTLFTLTRKGHQFSFCRLLAIRSNPVLSQFKRCGITYAHALHDLTCQFLTLGALRAGTICAYESERMIRDAVGCRRGEKQPDVVWLLNCEFRIAVEFERTEKFNKKLKNFICSIARTLETETSGTPGKFRRCVIFFESMDTADKYKNAISKYAEEMSTFDYAPVGWSKLIDLVVLED